MPAGGAGRCGWHHDSMAEPVRNRRPTIDLDDEDVQGAIERMAAVISIGAATRSMSSTL